MSDSITVVGNLAEDPILKSTATGIDVVSLRIASAQRWFDKANEKWVEGEPNWFTVSAYRSLATHASRSLHKGDRVIVHGKLRVRHWKDGDRRGTTVEIDADALGPDLRWGTSAFSRTLRTEPVEAPDAPESTESPVAEAFPETVEDELEPTPF